MKFFVALIVVSMLMFSSISRPVEVHAGLGDAILAVAIIGGAVYAGYHFSENYEVRKKSALEIEDGKFRFNRPDVSYEVSDASVTAESDERYSVGLVTVNF